MGGVFRSEYPKDLEKVVRHAERFAQVLAKVERKRGAGAWAVGRSSELRTVVSGAIEDWRLGVSDEERTRKAISSYLEGLHESAGRRLGGGALACCGDDEAITLVPGAESAVDSYHSVVGIDSVATTEQAAWVDSPEVMARFNGALGVVDEVAGAVVRRVGRRLVSLDDLKGFGREGLLDAARSFKEQGPFSAWARLRIRSAMFDGLRQFGPLPQRVWRELQALEARGDGGEEGSGGERAGTARQGDVKAGMDEGIGSRLAAIATAMGMGMAAVDPSGRNVSGHDEGGSPEERVLRAEFAALLREVVAELPGSERELVERCYYGGQTLEEAGAAMGVSKGGCSRILARARDRIDRALRARQVDAVSFLRMLARAS